ncbi:MAG: hypothetical protein ABSG37_13345 [Candidatus Limnocylindrales bacterium]|jgi:hypothetical protein
MNKGEKLVDFMQGFAAAVELDARAAKQGCFVECVCLTASIIDAMLRMGLILRHQLDTGTADLSEELLHQGEADAAISERSIYRRALASGIVDQAVFDELEALYQERNRVVHRYVISGISTRDVLEIALRQDVLKHRLSDAVAVLEEDQIRLGIGMTALAQKTVTARDVLDQATGKHGDAGLTEALREGL